MDFTFISDLMNINPVLLFFIFAWIALWKGLSLWKAARLNQPVWFVVLLVVNTFGLVEILYIFLFSEIKKQPAHKKNSKKRSGKKHNQNKRIRKIPSI